MPWLLDISKIGHIVATLAFFGVAAYAIIRQKSLYRTTNNYYVMFYFTTGTSLLFAFINIFLLVYHPVGDTESALREYLDSIAQYAGILFQSWVILVLFTKKIVTITSLRSACVLAIGAHPDDIEIAAGASLAKMRDAGFSISGLILTRGEKGGDGDTRPLEAVRGGKFLGMDSVQVKDYSDTHLSEEIVKITSEIEKVLEKVNPDIIFTHSPHDLHQDHQTIYEATMRATRMTRTTILCYESPSATQDFHPTYYIDVEKYVELKIQALREHWNQRKKPYMKPDIVRGKLAYRGSLAKVNYAEGFEVARMVSAI